MYAIRSYYVFGTRHIDATERHEGMVAAIAFESLVKLVAFLAVGVFVTFGLFAGPADLFGRAAEVPKLARLMSFEGMTGGYASWLSLMFLSMMAIMFLPRQFQVAVVENRITSYNVCYTKLLRGGHIWKPNATARPPSSTSASAE